MIPDSKTKVYLPQDTAHANTLEPTVLPGKLAFMTFPLVSRTVSFNEYHALVLTMN